jgi:hypothetical protein
MPEAAVNEDDFLPARKHDVRLAGKIGSMQFVLHSQGVEQGANRMTFRDLSKVPASMGPRPVFWSR